MPLKISKSQTFSWASIEAVNLKHRLVLRVDAPPGIIAKEYLLPIQREMESRTGANVLRVGEGMFIPVHTIAHVFLNDGVVEMLSGGVIDIDPEFMDSARAFCLKHAIDPHVE